MQPLRDVLFLMSGGRPYAPPHAPNSFKHGHWGAATSGGAPVALSARGGPVSRADGHAGRRSFWSVLASAMPSCAMPQHLARSCATGGAPAWRARGAVTTGRRCVWRCCGPCMPRWPSECLGGTPERRTPQHSHARRHGHDRQTPCPRAQPQRPRLARVSGLRFEMDGASPRAPGEAHHPADTRHRLCALPCVCVCVS